METYTEEYLKFLKKNIEEKDISKAVKELTLQFLDKYNDYIQIHVETLPKGKYRISDNNFIEEKIKEYTNIRQEDVITLIVQNILATGVKYDSNTKEFYIECEKENIGKSIHTMLHAMITLK